MCNARATEQQYNFEENKIESYLIFTTFVLVNFQKNNARKTKDTRIYTGNWQSTYALLHLETVVKKANAKEGEPIYSPAKPTGNQARFQYVSVATLYYKFVDTEKDYLNFTAKLMLGIKNEGTHIQYSITKIDVE